MCLSVSSAQILDWRRVGNAAIDLNLAAVATGPVARVWYSGDGTKLYTRTVSGQTFETSDFEQWQASEAKPPTDDLQSTPATPYMPERLAKLKISTARSGRIYAAGKFAYRSDDGGYNWNNLSGINGRSILGDGLADVATSPNDADEVVVAGAYGVWRSMDGGLSWSGLNQGLPNLPVKRILALPDGTRGLRISVDDSGSDLEWLPGEKSGWRVADNPLSAQELARKKQIGANLAENINALGRSGDFVYAGTADGKIWVSVDRGRSWKSFQKLADGARIEAIFVDGKDPQFALAVLGGNQNARVMRTVNGGLVWDDLTNNLGTAPAHGVTADRATGAVYVATDRGLYMTYADTQSAAPSTPWTLLREGTAADVALDREANQLYVAIDGAGVFATLAPHRLRDPRVVSAGDLLARAAAPGSLLTVIGSRVQAARTGDRTVPVLAAADLESQIQIPFEATGSALSLSMDSAAGRITFGLPLQKVAPAIFIDRDGGPIVLNGDSGLLLDPMNPARSNGRLQIFATGLGRVRPDWPAGISAPLENPPAVAAQVKVYLDRQPVEVSRAVLAPGYVGFYLIEVQLPSIVNRGTAELYVEAEGQQSNRVKVYLEP